MTGFRNQIFAISLVVTLSISILLICSFFVDLSRIHLGPSDRHLNDQVGYISVARNLVDSGVLQSNIIYPSTLSQNTDKNYLYMPGHYWALAASFRIFGIGLLQSYIPNILSYVIATVTVYLIGNKTYNLNIGILGATFFALFPIGILYSFTAMAELTLVCASLIALLVFIYLPQRFQPYLGPLLLVLPLLFRETGILLVIPMGFTIFRLRKEHIKSTSIFLAISLLITATVLLSDISAGRPSLMLANLFDDRFSTLYLDAVAQHAIEPQLLDFPAAIADKIITNVSYLIQSVIHLNLSFDIISLFFIVALSAASLIYGIASKDQFSLSAGIFSVALFITISAFYAFYSYRGLRILLLSFPLLCISTAYIYTKIGERFLSRLGSSKMQITVLSVLITVASFSAAGYMGNEFNQMDQIDDENVNFIQQINHDDSKLLVAPHELSLYYVYLHYPLNWSFVPANPQTLNLLADRYNIGTVIIPEKDYDSQYTLSDFTRLDLSLIDNVNYQGTEYIVFQKN